MSRSPETACHALFESEFYSYHQKTKHTLNGLMTSAHTLDWNNQPDPFRTYRGTKQINLAGSIPSPVINDYFLSLDVLRKGFGVAVDIPSVNSHPFDMQFISGLLFHSMAISAWKQIRGTNHKWPLRVNPSSGNLHPTDTHVIVENCDGIGSGDFHYLVNEHKLEQRSSRTGAPRAIWHYLGRNDDPQLLICLTSIFWRESWKYQSRAFRYCQHDMGHAFASIGLAAAAYGWRVEAVAEFADDELAELLGLKDLDEKPMLVLALFPIDVETGGVNVDGRATHGIALEETIFEGKPNALSVVQVEYPLIDKVYRATCVSPTEWKFRRDLVLPETDVPSFLEWKNEIEMNAGETPALRAFDKLVRTRRSAVDMDGHQRMTKDHFAVILESVTHGFATEFQRPRNAGGTPALHHLIHLFLYVHKVDDIVEGAYYYDQKRRRLLQLKVGDVRQAAKFVSCLQDIAADGCFALSMVGDLKTAFELHGDRCYRYLHYEAGYIGQFLYLTGEALGYESTGIGCFIDDEVNNFFGLSPGYEVIYNFTTGRAVLDPRLTELPAYDFLPEKRAD